MDDRARALREALEKSRGGRPRWRCPSGLRSEVVSYARERQALGEGIGSIAQALGLSESCLSRWLRACGGGFRAVRVSQPEAESSSGGLVLVTPRGFRLEGLTARLALRFLQEL
jgi:hypothetical protein